MILKLVLMRDERIPIKVAMIDPMEVSNIEHWTRVPTVPDERIYGSIVIKIWMRAGKRLAHKVLLRQGGTKKALTTEVLRKLRSCWQNYFGNSASSRMRYLNAIRPT